MKEPAVPLPDDVDALKAFALAMAEKAARAEAKVTALETLNAAADARIARLMSMLKSLERARYGKRSEKLGPDAVEQHGFVFEEIETWIAALEADHRMTSGTTRPPRPSRPRKSFAAHLERIEEVIEPEIPAEYLGLEKIRIGEGEEDQQTVQWTVCPTNVNASTWCRPASA